MPNSLVLFLNALLFKVVLFEYAYILNIFNRNVKFDKYNYLNFNNN